MPELQISIAQHYHQRTKYDPQTLARKSRALDFSQQPLPFKDYKLGTAYDLVNYLQDEPSNDPLVSQWQRLSRILHCSYGLTARVSYPGGNPFYLRAAPSAGGLYPAEVYLISGGHPSCQSDSTITKLGPTRWFTIGTMTFGQLSKRPVAGTQT